MKVFSVYGLRPKNVARINSGELLVEKAGYQPAYKEIAQMIASFLLFSSKACLSETN